MHYRDRTLGELAIAIPRATVLFREFNLDFCCGGKQTLLRAANKLELDIEALEARLSALAEQPSTETHWPSAPLGDIIPHIIQRYHDRHREQLPELILMAEKVERVHHEKSACPRWLASQLALILDDLSQHMMKEERILFPMIEAGMGAQASGPISVMEHEHDDAGQQLEVVKNLTNNVTPPENACNTWRALYAGINVFISDLMEHIHLENKILFPRALRGE
ncbi:MULTISPECIES: iron-sulfur cluster repair protein YtfE [Symbiopectobacterium]|uniref:iron-sulfur cluster repair protein YtfE n=2 Tax=ant, tsetse, mealybug, aphid, etc. endosymbionts TaxID=84563 RepID=UPI001A33728B|nr:MULTISPECIES: iron-sulfur cluster repair protein YtfE [Symbiopectobacterium]MBG6248853.1 iron-sulfur cluster repair protein YtfE [Candidatus Symbiopectobacterium sp. PLON1]MBT9430360.1 iron-sulfur cluster repair protein YtfE [Candidatus Symbiopectobacterium endolongispinus]